MDFCKYFKTPMEQWIEEQYRANGVLKPLDLDIDRIAMIFGVDIVYCDNSPFSENEDKVIFIDRRDDYIEQRKIFFTSFVMSSVTLVINVGCQNCFAKPKRTTQTDSRFMQ